MNRSNESQVSVLCQQIQDQFMNIKLVLEQIEQAEYTFISYPDGLSHSNRKMQPAATCTATKATMNQLVVSKGSKKAVGEIIPVFLATKMVIPVSKKGTEKSNFVPRRSRMVPNSGLEIHIFPNRNGQACQTPIFRQF